MIPAVSVVLPCHNRRDSLRASILSVLTQSFADFELIVVDDGSTQDIKSVVEGIEDWRLRYIRRSRNGGAAAARNTGIAEARASFIAFQDSDDIWLPGKLERQLTLFAQLPPDVGVVTSHRILYGRDEHYVFGSEKVCVAPSLRTWPKGADQVGAMLHGNRLSLPCALFRRSILPGPDWFDTCAKANEDWEFAVRISQLTRIHEDDRPVMLSYISADSISGSMRKQSLGTVRILRVNRGIIDRYRQQKAAILLDVARTLAATSKPRWARRFLLRSLATHPSAWGLLAQSVVRRTGRAVSGVARRERRKTTGGGAVTRLALFAQRHSHMAPPVLRKLGRSVVGRSLPTAPVVEGWSTQLIGSLPLPEAPQPMAVETQPPAAAAMPQKGSPLRCIVVTGVLDVGGTDEVAAFLARRLPEYGIETVVAHTGSKVGGAGSGRLPSLLRQEGIRVEDVDEGGAAALIKDVAPDMISAHCPPAWWLEAAMRFGVPFVETLHGMHDLFDADWAEEARRARHKSYLIAVSDLVRRQYLQRNPAFDARRIVTVPNSVDPNRVPVVDRKQARDWLGLGDEFLFISLARHTLQKNGYALVEAFGEVAALHADAHLLIAGRPDNATYTTQLGQLQARLPSSNRIHLRDHAPWTGALLAAADAFVMDSFFEGWSLATMEALCAGLPVVASDVGGAREQIGDDGTRGILVPNPLGDPLAVNWRTLGNALYSTQANRPALVSAMSSVVSNRSHWSERRTSLRMESLARFSPDRALEGHARILRAAAMERQRPELTVAS